MAAKGPLAGVRVVELGGVGPVPFCGMYLADMGAEVIRIERPLGDDPLSRSRRQLNLLARGKRSIAMDFRNEAGRAIVQDMVRRSDIVIEGFRPGTLERLGLGPQDCLAISPALVYGRMSGWGNEGPLARLGAHDINYLALSGLLGAIGPHDQPYPPLNIVGDFGGALYLVAGLLCALTHARTRGEGQVVDASIMGGSVALMTQLYAIHDAGEWRDQRESNWMDGGAPYYRCYATSDGGFMAVGAIEAKFFAGLVDGLGLTGEIDPRRQMDRSYWPEIAGHFTATFRTRTRAAWTKVFEEVDGCCTPVLSLDEARKHDQARANGMYATIGGRIEPAPQPYFSHTPAPTPQPATPQGGDAAAILRDLGRSLEEAEQLYRAGVVARPD
ncbi:alpha-methylacyl-CoA racemase [Sphingobium faniae]|nr:alpha-methylacyl-CoA racemase [Sphingobium faniae]